MDFLIGIMLVIICILLLFNFTTISISDSKFGNGRCAIQPNNLITTMQNGGLLGTHIPIPANNSTINSMPNSQYSTSYDYSKYFFVS